MRRCGAGTRSPTLLQRGPTSCGASRARGTTSSRPPLSGGCALLGGPPARGSSALGCLLRRAPPLRGEVVALAHPALQDGGGRLGERDAARRPTALADLDALPGCLRGGKRSIELQTNDGEVALALDEQERLAVRSEGRLLDRRPGTRDRLLHVRKRQHELAQGVHRVGHARHGTMARPARWISSEPISPAPRAREGRRQPGPRKGFPDAARACRRTRPLALHSGTSLFR